MCCMRRCAVPPRQASQHPRCVLHVTTMPRTRRDKSAAAAAKLGPAFTVGPKFKLSGVMVATSQPALWGFPEQAGQLEAGLG